MIMICWICTRKTREFSFQDLYLLLRAEQKQNRMDVSAKTIYLYRVPKIF